MIVQIDSSELARLRTEATMAKSDRLTAKCNCDRCKYLHVLNMDDIYAYCRKTGYVFAPFETDTRTHFCAFAEVKNGSNI